jgi:hypothetical protein
MKVMRRFITEPGDSVAVALANTPDPEKGVLNAKFSLTRLPVLSDDDLTRAKSRRKARKQMTNVEVENDTDETKDTPGREKKYELNLEAEGVITKDDVLTKDQKTEDGKVVKTHSITSKEIVVSNLNGFLNLFNSDETKMFAFVSEAVTSYYQRTDRQRLNALAQGPEKNMARAIKALVAGGIPEATAKTFVENQFKEQGLI